MDEEEKEKNFLQKLCSSDAGRKIVLFAGAAGIALIFVSSMISGSSGKSGTAAAKTASSSAAVQSQSDDENYSKKLETELTSIISKIKGAGTPHVLVTLEEGSTQVYAQEEKHSAQQGGSSGSDSNADSKETGCIIVKDSDGSEHALTVTRRQPKVQGVVVTCSGAADPQVQQAVINAVSAAAGVNSSEICVAVSNDDS